LTAIINCVTITNEKSDDKGRFPIFPTADREIWYRWKSYPVF